MMIWLASLTLPDIIKGFSYWVAFWSIVNILLPPREIFDKTPPWYNTMLKLVAYYGALNLRQISVKLYSAVQQDADPVAESLAKAQSATKEAASAVTEAKDIVEEKKEDK